MSQQVMMAEGVKDISKLVSFARQAQIVSNLKYAVICCAICCSHLDTTCLKRPF